MKNILIHLHPSKRFDSERSKLARVQVDNSLALGWPLADLLMVTNFPWEYNGVKAVEIGDEHFCAVRPQSTNTVTVPYLIQAGLIKPGELCWVHDFDAYQETVFLKKEPDLGKADLGLTTYGWSPKWCLGSFFFTSYAQDIFTWIKAAVEGQSTEDERALVGLTRENYLGIRERIKELNITWNFGMRNVEENWERADKPLRVVHFHPFYRERGLVTREVFIDGKNDLNRPLVSERLRRIFADHGI